MSAPYVRRQQEAGGANQDEIAEVALRRGRPRQQQPRRQRPEG